MKLSKLYSNQKKFKNITFNLKGLNVVYAEVKAKLPDRKNSHNLGKSKLAEIIDFMFLKELDKNHFLLKNKNSDDVSIFLDYIFYLELLLNDGRYLTVCRGVEKNTRISFAVNEATANGYNPPLNWVHENVPIRKAKSIFSEFLDLDFFKMKSYDYRKVISYCLRTPPNDYNDVYKLAKFGPSKDLYWKPFMFDLLGFNGQLLAEKYEIDLQKDELDKSISNMERDHLIKIEDRDDYVAQMKLIEKDVQRVEKEIDLFNFYEQDKKLIRKGVEEIELKISELNAESYNLNYEIEKLSSSIKNEFAFDTNKIKKIFEEANIFFSDQLKENYDSLVDFNNKLTKERNRLLKQTLKEKNHDLNEVNGQLEALEKEKESLLSFLQETDSFKKFKHYQKELVKIEGKLFSIRDKIKYVDLLIQKVNEREETLEMADKVNKKLRQVYQHTEDNQKYSSIRENFSRFYHEIMNENARLSWQINAANNIEFIPPKVQSNNGEGLETAKDEGNTYKKLLCVAFDLAILCTYSKESFYRFVYHDDVFSQEDNRVKNRLLNLIRNISSECNIQYILSVIKADLPRSEDDELIDFEDKEVILKLHDRDDSGTLFGFEF